MGLHDSISLDCEVFLKMIMQVRENWVNVHKEKRVKCIWKAKQSF